MYASVEKFAGQRASIGRDVVVGTTQGPAWGKIVAIDERRGLALFVPPIGISVHVEGAAYGYEFRECLTEVDVNDLPQFAWTWPVRV
jgi:hypothetical protein